ncbi:alpha/beta hydrolase [Streptomyces sp. NPDC056390]|uniref:alpha/beta hydrolase n=1 Tax=Streptomyces sp. NPDC056390 TaxID=3345806 RepID=UPI0035E15B03
MLDEASRALLQQLADSGTKPFSRMTVREARDWSSGMSASRAAGPPMARVSDHRVEVKDGAVDVRLFVPEGDVRGLMVYYHGGGWVIGGIPQSDAFARILADRTGWAVLLVDYRLAPEHRYPTAVDDAWSALLWAADRTTELVGADLPLCVAGDSAGGNLAAVVAQRARTSQTPALALQVLVYPATDSDTERPSYRAPDNQLLVDRDSMLWFWDHYAPDAAARVEPEAAPLRADDLSGLPPAIVITAEFDPLRDEGMAYAERLRQAGVRVEAGHFPDQMHGFFPLVGVLPGSDAAIGYLSRTIRRLLNVDRLDRSSS